MIVRAIDNVGDWLYGKGKNDYKTGREAVAQCIQTRLYSFLGDCFFATNEGIDWFNLLGSKQRLALELAVSSTILNTENVTAILELTSSLDERRNLTLNYRVRVDIGNPEVITGEVTVSPTDFLVTEDGNKITTEDDDPIILE